MSALILLILGFLTKNLIGLIRIMTNKQLENLVLKYSQLSKRVNQLEKEIRRLRSDNQQLKSQIQQLRK